MQIKNIFAISLATQIELWYDNIDLVCQRKDKYMLNNGMRL